MTRRTRLSWSLSIISATLVAAGLAAVIASVREDTGDDSFLISTLAFVVPIVTFSFVGGLITSRQPGNAIGWLLAVIGLLFAMVAACSSIASWGLTSGKIPEGLAEWIDLGANAWVVALGLIGTQLLIRLPDGTLPSPRWRWYSRVSILLIAVALIGMAAQTGPVEGVPGAENPLASATVAGLSNAFFLVILSFPIGIVALVMRYRRSSGHDRGQLRWVAFSGAVFVTTYIACLPLLSLVGENSTAGTALTSFIQTAFAALPIGIGFAVLRQRLYDIDVVINRALVYGSLTAMLAGAYLGTVLILHLALRAFTEGSGLAVAASTLATAALFRPLRAGTQAVVDRRFFRRKYDAVRTLKRFNMRVRNEVDLEALQSDLRAVVAETMQPEHLSLWLRTHQDSRNVFRTLGP
ncbi:MAG: hypothetical protein ABIR57_04275 [Aeromicrobium sp.]